MSYLISPHGGSLCNLLVPEEKAQELKEESLRCLSIDLSQRQQCDLELLLNGGFSPLKGFMTQEDYDSVLNDFRLKNGIVWPMPITLDISEEMAEAIRIDDRVALRDDEGFLLAILNVRDVWQVEKKREAIEVFGSNNGNHPGVHFLHHNTQSHYIGGDLEGIQLPIHYDFKMHRHTPFELREIFKKRGWRRVVAFQTRNPLHRAHVEMTLRATEDADANLLIHPVVGMTKTGDISYYTRVHCYTVISERYPPNMMMMSLLPLAMRMAGPREALWHAIIRKNFGCSHFIIGRDHAGAGSDSNGKPFNGPYDAQELVKQFESEIGISILPFKEMGYVEKLGQFMSSDEVPEGEKYMTISGTELRRRLTEGLDIPEWFSYPEVVQELRKIYPPREKQGFTIFFTGLSSSGKSTVAKVLLEKFLEMGGRPVTLLDGDIVRKNLSSELGFSKSHRDLNIQRIGFVASEITKNGGIAICAPIAPYEEVRRNNRVLISQVGGYIEVYVSTPIEICEKRDRKGLYAKARAGIVKNFTGIDDPYEEPKNAEICMDTSNMSPEEAAQEVLLYLEKAGYIK